MPVVVRAETDLFRLAPLYERLILVNLTNCVGAAGKGLALAFRGKFPANHEAYVEAHRREELAIGSLVIHEESDKVLIVNMPTKRHWMDASSVPDVILGLKALREVVLRHSDRHVIMAAPGTGLGNLGVSEIFPHVTEALDDLPNIIHMCVAPEKMKRIPRYLGLIGPRDFEDEEYIHLALADTVLDWGLVFQNFDGIVTGDEPGVNTLAAKMADQYKFKKIIVRSDTEHFGDQAAAMRNPVIADIATHLLAFTHVRSINVDHIVSCAKAWNDYPDVEYVKRLAIINVESKMKRVVNQ